MGGSLRRGLEPKSGEELAPNFNSIFGGIKAIINKNIIAIAATMFTVISSLHSHCKTARAHLK